MAHREKLIVDRELRGLVYFDSFEELEKWTPKDVDPLQQSNTPLLKRAVAPTKIESSNVMLMHDYKGGYLDNGYEGCQGAIIPNEEYFLEQWQRVEAFNYFTHHRVTIPPSTWINTGHRNGALVLGTFIVESADPNEKPAPDAKLMLNKKADGTYLLADKLASIAACYGFDGWLMNVESKIDVEDRIWDGGRALESMLSQLKERLSTLTSGGMVLWYDAVTNTNVGGCWQNTLNAKNSGFAKSAGSFVTNYWWEQDYLADAAKCADSDEVRMRRKAVYFGTDCWAQNDDLGRKNTRQTHGETNVGEGDVDTGTGHGGTATGLGVKSLPSYGMSAGIFGPGWAYEHFVGARDVDRFMWEGTPSLDSIEGLQCRCRNGIQQHIRSDLKDNPIAKFATQFPAGSEAFFHTDYKEPINQLSHGKYFAHVGQQSILPPPAERSASLHISRQKSESGMLLAHLESSPSRCSICICPESTLHSISDGSQVTGRLSLHKISARADLGLQIIVKYSKPLETCSLTFCVFAEVGMTTIHAELPAEQYKEDVQVLSIPKSQDRVTAIGITVQGSLTGFAKPLHSGIVNVLEILEITLKPAKLSYPQSFIYNARIEKRGTVQESSHCRLIWSIPNTAPTPHLPWSQLTGPYSHFVISLDGKESGRAYALQYILENGIYRAWKEMERKSAVYVKVQGYAFDGSEIGVFSGDVSLA